MTEHVLNFKADGTITGVYTDALPLASLGAMTVKRASNVEFNPATQQWEVRWERATAGSDPVFANPSRATCIAWEVETLNKELANEN